VKRGARVPKPIKMRRVTVGRKVKVPMLKRAKGRKVKRAKVTRKGFRVRPSMTVRGRRKRL